MRSWWWVVGVVGCTPKVATVPAGPDAPTAAVDPAVAGVTSPALAEVLTEHWNATMERFPEWATQLGDHRFDAAISDPSDAAVAAWREREEAWSLRLGAMPDPMLSRADLVTRDLLLESLRSDVALSVCRFHQWQVSPRGNALVDANALAEEAIVTTPADGANLVARYRALPAAIDAASANLRAGLATGRVENADSVRKVVEMLDLALGASPDAAGPLVAPADAPHDDWPADALAAFRTDLRGAVTDGIRPALDRYRAVLRDEVLPKGRTGGDVGLHALPDGDVCYRATIRDNTTLDRSADELHTIGLSELASIHAEFRTLGAKVLGTDDLAEIFRRLRTDPALHFATADEVRSTAEGALRRAEAAVPQWFGRVPTSPCTVDVIPDYLAPYTTVAYYQPVRPDGSKPGIYYVNVLAPETRPRTEAEALAFHESVPGHHLQIALAQEQGALPAFRRYQGATAFVEGWALYSERLADEMGLYSGDLDRLGMLSFDAWRASRLVVDTGIHAQGWSRAQAEQFMLDNTPLAENNVANEVDRYITTPGQALAYKTGQLELRRLRSEAEQALGAGFDVRAFHDEVLDGGAVSMTVLREKIARWIDAAGS
ncbi:MAG: DUF885 domain-containing protein [Myxococcota bacterium]